MMRVLVVSYSQSGDVFRSVQSFVRPLATDGVEFVWANLRPCTPYPSPWRSLGRFFDVFPECILEQPSPIEPPPFEPNDEFALVVLAYPVWFLSPALPVQSLLRSPYAEVLRGRKVITLSVSRNMWHSAPSA